jgi:hypothetical protein
MTDNDLPAVWDALHAIEREIATLRKGQRRGHRVVLAETLWQWERRLGFIRGSLITEADRDHAREVCQQPEVAAEIAALNAKEVA